MCLKWLLFKLNTLLSLTTFTVKTTPIRNGFSAINCIIHKLLKRIPCCKHWNPNSAISKNRLRNYYCFENNTEIFLKIEVKLTGYIRICNFKMAITEVVLLSGKIKLFREILRKNLCMLTIFFNITWHNRNKDIFKKSSTLVYCCEMTSWKVVKVYSVL